MAAALLMGLLLLGAGCGDDGDQGQLGNVGLNATVVPLELQPAGPDGTSAALDALAERLRQDRRCPEVYRHFSAVVGIGSDVGCLQTYDLLFDLGIVGSDQRSRARAALHVESLPSSANRAGGLAEIYGEYVVLLIENSDGTVTIAVDTTDSAAQNNSINDLIIARGSLSGRASGE